MVTEQTAGQAGGRVFLLLQGPYSYFFTYLARALAERGAAVTRVLFCPGDALFHRGSPALHYRGERGKWAIFAESWMKNHGVTDLVCLGDGRRIHDDAIEVARKIGVRVHVIEQGYLRPHFLTVEPDGTGGRSRFPRDWAAISRLAEGHTPPTPPGFRTSFAAYALMDVGFNLANLALSWLFYPNYKRHSLDHPIEEWSGWVWNRFLKRRPRARARARAMGEIAAQKGPLFLLPLQLDTDYQMRLHAPPGGVDALLRRTILSFAAHAPADARLVVKRHPLDHGWVDWRAVMEEEAREAGVLSRVTFLDGGDLDALLARAAGVVVANSTVGLTALRAGVPTIVLGTAIYDLPGLCWQGGLDGFWEGGTRPDPARLTLFLTALGAAIQVPGGFDGTGAEPGAAAMADRMMAPPPW